MLATKSARLLIATGLSFAALSGARAQAFTFTEIANTKTSDFTGFQATAINDLGEVAFTAEAAGQLGIFQGDGGAIAPVVPFGAGLVDIEGIDFNSDGTVAFSDNSTPGLFTSDGNIITPIVTPATALGQLGFLPDAFSAPDINEAGSVAFQASDFGTGDLSLHLFEGNAITTIAKSPGFDIFRFSLNNNNDVAFFAIAAVADDGDAIFLRESAGAPVPLPDPLSFGTIEGPTLNDSKTVAFDTLFLNDEAESLQGIFIQNDEDISLIVDTSGDFNTFTRPAVNNTGSLVFGAGLDNGDLGLFAGADPVSDRVIAIGDDFFGSTVTALSFTQQTGLNNLGQFTFNANFADGSTGVYRADFEQDDAQAVPEPTSVLTLLAVGLMGLTSQQRRRREYS
ncbi:MAG: choice-of-anchor tandem repeat NxxGxxAF-containing protein, partial [Cyanobacteria bacterium J06597_16]